MAEAEEIAQKVDSSFFREKLEYIREHWVLSLIIVVLALTLIFFVLLISGRQNCEITSVRDGVFQTCDCWGFEITVKSTANSGTQKTVCVGRISNRQTYKQ